MLKKYNLPFKNIGILYCGGRKGNAYAVFIGLICYYILHTNTMIWELTPLLNEVTIHIHTAVRKL